MINLLFYKFQIMNVHRWCNRVRLIRISARFSLLLLHLLPHVALLILTFFHLIFTVLTVITSFRCLVHEVRTTTDWFRFWSQLLFKLHLILLHFGESRNLPIVFLKHFFLLISWMWSWSRWFTWKTVTPKGRATAKNGSTSYCWSKNWSLRFWCSILLISLLRCSVFTLTPLLLVFF